MVWRGVAWLNTFAKRAKRKVGNRVLILGFHCLPCYLQDTMWQKGIKIYSCCFFYSTKLYVLIVVLYCTCPIKNCKDTHISKTTKPIMMEFELFLMLEHTFFLIQKSIDIAFILTKLIYNCIPTILYVFNPISTTLHICTQNWLLPFWKKIKLPVLYNKN